VVVRDGSNRGGKVNPEQAARVLAAFEKADDFESLMWRVTLKPYCVTEIKMFAGCSDFFHLATADAEEITADDLPLVEQCVADLGGTGEEFYLAELFAARKRKMRPLRSAYKGMAPAVAALFDGCSTEEERAEVDQRDRAFWAGVAHKARSDRAATKEAG
jgi:hypothetical protein